MRLFLRGWQKPQDEVLTRWESLGLLALLGACLLNSIAFILGLT